MTVPGSRLSELSRASAPTGVGLSATPEEAVKLCRWIIEGRGAVWRRLGYLQIGIYSHSDIPDELPGLLREAGVPCVVHFLELNLMRPLAQQAARVTPLLERVARLEPLWVEQDVGLWTWGQTELDAHMIQAIFDEQTAAAVAESSAELQRMLGIPFLPENPPIYFELGTLDVLSFMGEVARQSGCGLVLDIGHLVGFCVVSDRDPVEYLGAWDGIEHVREIHVAGYNLVPDERAPMWYDDHGDVISAYALELIDVARQRAGRPLPITLEQQAASFGRIATHINRVADRFAGTLQAA